MIQPPPPTLLNRLWRWSLFQLLVYVLLLVGAWLLLGRVRHLVVSVLVAYLIAHLAQPLLQRLERRGVIRPVGITLLVLALLGLLAGMTPLLTAVFQELQALVVKFPELLGSVNQSFSRLALKYPFLHGLQVQAEQWLTVNSGEWQGRVTALVSHLLGPQGALVSGLLGAAGWLGRAFITLVISIYMMAAYPSIGPFLLRLLPLRHQTGALEVSQHVSRAVGGYFRGQLTVALIMGGVIGLGLTLLGVPSALAIGFLAALLNIVPYLGVILTVIPALLLAAPLGTVKLLLVAALFLAANQLEGHVIAPRVVSQNTHLSSLAVLLAILFGVELFGLMGAVIAVPALAAVKSLMTAYYYRSEAYRRGATASAKDRVPDEEHL